MGIERVIDSPDALTDQADDRIARANAKIRADWASVNERHRNTRGGKARAYSVAVGNVSNSAPVDRATDLSLPTRGSTRTRSTGTRRASTSSMRVIAARLRCATTPHPSSL